MIPINIQQLLTDLHNYSNLDIKHVIDLPLIHIRGIGEQYSKILNQHGFVKICDLTNIQDHDNIPVPKPLLMKWSIAAKIIVDYTTGQESSGGKIIFAGLSQAGKTSIINVLKAISTKTEPTTGAKPDILKLAGIPIKVTDMGGQIVFRKMYVENPTAYFSNAKIVFYVIDIQDLKTFSESLDYLERILAIYRYLRQKPTFTIHFHKYDMDKAYELKFVIPPYIEKINSLFQKYWEFPMNLHYTSIFNPPSLYITMSSSLKQIFPVFGLLNSLLEEFAQLHDFDGLFLLDDKGMMLGKYLDEDQPKSLIPKIFDIYNKVVETKKDSFLPLLLSENIEDPKGNVTVQHIYLPQCKGYAIFWKVHEDLENYVVTDIAMKELTKSLNPWLYNILKGT